jgi:trimeric autotransporter adhesin
MKNNSLSLFVRRPTWGGRICAFRLLCAATVLVSLFSGLGLAQDAALAQAPAANTITCSSGTACKKGNIPIFASNGGAAKVDDSIINQSGSTISVAGSETATQNISAGGNVSATGNLSGANVSATGSISGATVSASSNVSAGGNVTATGTVSGGVVNAGTSFDLAGFPFAHGSIAQANALLGFAGNTSMTGEFNTASGYEALLENGTGEENTADGFVALISNTTGGQNTASGGFALYSNTTGKENTATGFAACDSNTTGNDLTCTGYGTAAADHLHNATAIGAHAMVSVSNALVLGSVAGVNGAKATARIGIGTTSPTNLLTLGKGAGSSISDGWTTYSSRRWKTNIQPLHDALGMVERLQGVSYDMKESGKHEIGVIAEEVGAVVPEVVSYEENGKDARGVDYSRLTALLIEATKQQQREIRQQQTLLRTQAAAIRDLKSELRVTRTALQKVQAQMAAAQPALVAAK